MVLAHICGGKKVSSLFFKEFHHFSYYVSHMCKITPAAMLLSFFMQLQTKLYLYE